jgi:hypothetical protein
MKHNTLLLLIFIPILVYQLYHTFRYWKEGLEPSAIKPPPPPSGPRWEMWKDLPDFCKGRDYGVVSEKWNKKTEESKCKWKGVPEDDKTHCIYKQREWCEKDCKGKFDHKGRGAWCKDVATGGKDTLRVPDSGAPFCDGAFMENFDKHCPLLDEDWRSNGSASGKACNCWEKIKLNEAVCKLPADAQKKLGGSSGSIVFKMHCTKGFTKDEYIKYAMSEGGKSENAEMAWKILSKDGYFSAESIRHYTTRIRKEGERARRDDAERKKAGIGPNPKDKLEAELPTDDSGLSSKAYAIATKTRKQALASGKPVAEAEGDGQRAAAKISDGGTSKDRVQEVIKNIAGGGGSLAVQAIGSQLAKLESDKKAAEAAMAKIPNSRTPAVRGDTASGSLGAAPTPGKAWIDGQGGSSFEANTTEPPNAGVVPGTHMAPDITSLLAAHEKQFHPSNNSSKQSDLKGTSLKKVNSEVNKNGWCIPQKNTQGKILSWIAKPINTPGWSKTDKCLTIEGKEIIFGTGSCLQGQTEDECNLGLVKLQKDKYWHTHPVLLRKIKENGPTPTPLGSKYV